MHVFMVCLSDVFIAWVAGALIQKQEAWEVSYWVWLDLPLHIFNRLHEKQAFSPLFSQRCRVTH
jgi:GMP synthase-like glutamine amidotransferase